jgi:hypothetical protein
VNYITTQKQQIQAHLKRFGRITPVEALNRYGCFRLGARVYELRESGMPIDTHMKTVRTRNGKAKVAEYSLRAS